MTASRTRRLRARGPADPKGVEYIAAFTVLWCKLLWETMARTGKGFPKPKIRRKGRRPDKANGTATPKALRGVAVRGLRGGHVPTRPWVTMTSRRNRIEALIAKREQRT